MEQTNVIKVLLVDDQPLVRKGFSMVLSTEKDIQVVGEASDGLVAISQVEALKPDVVLMDIRMPNMNGIQATEEIVSRYPNSRVLVLTTFDIEEYAFGALRKGASGFLTKDALPEQLTQAIRSVASGDATISPKITRRMLELFAEQLPTPTSQTQNQVQSGTSTGVDPALSELTARELEVLELIATGYNNAEIAEKLFVSTPTIKTHVSNILSKLGLRDRIHAVIYAYENGVINTHN